MVITGKVLVMHNDIDVVFGLVMFNTQETIIFMYRYSCETDPYLHLQLPVLFVSFFSRSFK